MRFFLPILILLCSFAVADERPNVVLILSDDQGWGDYGFMGHPILKTPHLDALAARSRLYEKGYVVSPLCRPSLASIVTGLFPHQHGIVGNDVSPAKKLERDKEDRPVRQAFHQHPSLVRELTQSGYLTFQSGKWWEGSFEEGGFTHGMTHGDPKRGGRHGDIGLKIGRDGMRPVEDFLDLSIAEKKPFFLWYAPFLPHTPHNAQAQYLERFADSGLPEDVVKYYANCEWFDDTCGQLLKALEERDLSQNTVVVYLCDNGWTAPSHSLMPSPEDWWPSYAPKSKGSPYEGGIRTPIMISHPEKIAPERITDSFASSIDIFPTIASICDLETSRDLPGVNLLNEKRSSVCGGTWAIHNMVANEPNATLLYTWCISDQWKLLRKHDGIDNTKYATVNAWDLTPLQLFDLHEDPDETMNLAQDHPKAVSQLVADIDHHFPLLKP